MNPVFEAIKKRFMPGIPRLSEKVRAVVIANKGIPKLKDPPHIPSYMDFDQEYFDMPLTEMGKKKKDFFEMD